MYLGTQFGEQVIIVNVGAPHRLVHVGHQAYIGMTEYGACERGL